MGRLLLIGVLLCLISAIQCRVPSDRRRRQIIFVDDEPRCDPTASCTLLDTCPSLFHLLESKQNRFNDLLRKSSCGFQGNDPLVCCPPQDSPLHPAVESPNPPVPVPQPVPAGPLRPPVPSAGNPASVLPKECGISKITRTRIVGGRNAPRGAWPWLAHLRFINETTGDVYRVCGAALITQEHVLSAAHCFRADDKLVEVRLGEHESGTKEDEETSQSFRATQLMPHKQFNRQSFENDMAMIKLDRKAQYTDWVQPICLPTSAISARDLTGTRGWVAGWGATRENGRASSILKEVQVPLITNTACKSAYDGTPAQINTNVFCAGAKQGGRDSCQGDSGGPYMVEKDGRFYALGVVSFGIGCAQAAYPGVYSSNSAFMEWINQHLV